MENKIKNIPLHFFCFCCGKQLKEIGLGYLYCESCDNTYLPYINQEDEQALALVATKEKGNTRICSKCKIKEKSGGSDWSVKCMDNSIHQKLINKITNFKNDK